MSLKFKSYTRSISIVDNSNLEHRALKFLLVSFGALGIFYVLILGNMVFNIIERRNFEDRVRILSNEVKDLELSYLSLSSAIDLEFSHSMGFRETDIKFATRKALGSLNGGLTIAQNEI